MTQFDWSATRYLADGVTVPPDGFAMLDRDFDAILLGAFGDPRVTSNIHAKEILLGMRFKMDLYANVRPVRLLDASLCPLKGIEPRGHRLRRDSRKYRGRLRRCRRRLQARHAG